MHDINKLTLLGNVSKPPAIREDGSVSFELVTARNVDPGVEEKHFQTVIAKGSKGIFCLNYITKGSRVYVEGFIRKVRQKIDETAENYEYRQKEITLWYLDATDIAPGSKLERVGSYDHTLPIPAPTSNLDDKSLKLTSDFSDLE